MLDATFPTYLARNRGWNDPALTDAVTANHKAPEHRDIWVEAVGETTRQVHGNGDDRDVFLEHRGDDKATASITYAKRLRFSQRAANERRIAATQVAGMELFEAFTRAVPIPQETFNDSLLEACRTENDTVHLTSKPLATLINNAERSDPSWSLNMIKLFIKGQTVKKLEKMGSDATAGQSIASFRAQVLLAWGPYARYIDRRIRALLPPHIYIHSRRTNEDFEQFVATHWDHTRESTDGDYTAYDASQDATFVNFETLLMRRLDFPLDVIEAYVEMKASITSHFGPLAIMRFSGEVWTYLFNTLGNIAFTYAKYEVPPVAQVYGGDDKSINSPITIRTGWAQLVGKFNLVEKPVVGYEPTFCGWRIVPGGIVKDPQLLFWRTRYARIRYDAAMWAPGYYDELVLSLKTSDRLMDHMSPNDLAYLQALVRFYTKLSRRLPSLADRRRSNPLPADSPSVVLSRD